jgi:hypothetical protein
LWSFLSLSEIQEIRMEANAPRIDHKNLRTVSQLVEEAPWLTTGKLRWLLFHRETNGLNPCVIQLGGRLYIDVPQFQAWLAVQGAH